MGTHVGDASRTYCTAWLEARISCSEPRARAAFLARFDQEVACAMWERAIARINSTASALQWTMAAA